MNYRFAWITVLLLAACTAAHAQGYMTATPWRATNLQHLAVWDNANRAAAGKDGNTLLRRAVRADRKARTVTLLAESCGLAANATVEFGLVGETSDRAYEALFLTFARATDIGDALEFIGLPRGRNVSSRAQRYWPSGERVVIKVREFGATNAPARPIEEFVLDRRINSTMVQRGFVYCGSPRVPGTEEGGAEACLADLEAPVSILSLYNEPQTLLDVPRISPQGEVYENYITNPDALLPAGRMMQVTLTPEPRPDGCPRVRPVELTILPSEGPGGVAFLLREGEKGEPQRIEAFGDLLEELMKLLPESDEDGEEKDAVQIAVVGKPNVGKSSLVNRLLGEERVMVSDIAGTTRDAIDTRFRDGDDEFVIIDTAGIRRKRSIEYQSLERFSVVRALAAIDRCDVAILLIDAVEGVTEQDAKIAGYIDEVGKAAILCVNKWDAMEKETGTLEKYVKDVREGLKFMAYAPVSLTSMTSSYSSGS